MTGRQRSTKKTETAPKAKKRGKFAGLDELGAEVTKSFGSDLMTPVSKKNRDMTHIDTGIFLLDFATHGGIPENTSTMLVGWESSGKTSLATKIMANAQKKYPNKAALVMDEEGTFDTLWAEKLGMSEEQTYLSRPVYAEQTVDIITGALQTMETSIIALDSLASMALEGQVEASSYDKQVADRARLIGVMCSKVKSRMQSARLHKNPITFLMINQFRTKIGNTGGKPAAPVIPGGNQPKFLATTIIRMNNLETVGEAQDKLSTSVQYNTHTFDIKKNKAGNSLRKGEFKMVRDPSHPLGEGFIDDAATVITYAKRFGLWGGAGSKQYIDNVDGMDRVDFPNMSAGAEWCYENPVEFNLIKRQIIKTNRARFGMQPIPCDGYLLGWVK